MMVNKTFFLTLFGGTASFLWRYVWINFITIITIGKIYPVFFALLFFWGSFFTTKIIFGKGARYITVGILHMLIFTVINLACLHSVYGVASTFINPGWISGFFSLPRGFSDWFFLVLIMIMPVLLWGGGTRLYSKNEKCRDFCGLLDIGIAFFFLLFLVKMFLRLRCEIIIPDPYSIRLFFPFLLFGLAGVSISRDHGDAEKKFLSSHKGVGIFLFSSVIFLMLITGLTLVLMPFLNTAAEESYKVLGTVFRPVGNLLLILLKLLLGGPNSRVETAPSGGADGAEAQRLGPAEGNGLAGKVFIYFIIGIFLITVTIVLIYLLSLLLRKLFKKNMKITPEKNNSFLFLLMSMVINSLKHLVFTVKRYFTRMAGGYTNIREIYTDFLKWGKRGGLQRSKNETPQEYKNRLCNVYSFAVQEINIITEIFCDEYYAGTATTGPDLASCSEALKHLKRPKFYYSRLKAWFR